MDGAARRQVVAAPKMRAILEPAAPAMVDTKPGCHFRDPVVAEPGIVERICRAAVGEFDARKGIESDPGPALADQIGEDPGNVVHHSAVYGVHGRAGLGRRHEILAPVRKAPFRRRPLRCKTPASMGFAALYPSY